LKTWILLSEHISRDGSFCILTMLRYKNKLSYVCFFEISVCFL
jgi:hypothetical protein